LYSLQAIDVAKSMVVVARTTVLGIYQKTSDIIRFTIRLIFKML